MNARLRPEHAVFLALPRRFWPAEMRELLYGPPQPEGSPLCSGGSAAEPSAPASPQRTRRGARSEAQPPPDDRKGREDGRACAVGGEAERGACEAQLSPVSNTGGQNTSIASGDAEATDNLASLGTTVAKASRAAALDAGESARGGAPLGPDGVAAPHDSPAASACPQNTTTNGYPAVGPTVRPFLNPRVVGYRLDALQVAWRVLLDAQMMLELGMAHSRAVKSPAKVTPWKVGGVPFALNREGAKHGYMYRLTNADATILVGDIRDQDDPEKPGWNVEVSLRAAYLATHTREQACDYASELAACFAKRDRGFREPWALGERVRRMDLAVDMTGCTFSTDDRKAIVKRGRNVKDYKPESQGAPNTTPAKTAIETHWRKGDDGEVTGFTVSPGNSIMCRIYDKRAEMAQWDPLNEKVQVEREIWQRAGVTDADEVWRIEFQLRRDALEQMGIETLNDVMKNLDKMWAYCTRKWLRIVDLTTATRKERAEIDLRWKAIQGVTWREQMEPATRVRRKRGGPNLVTTVGTVVAHLAATGDVVCDGDADEVIRKNGEALVEHMLAQPREAKERFVAACRAQRARFGSIDDVKIKAA